MTIGERIKKARLDKGITQEGLGKLCNTTKQTIHKYETGIVTNIPLEKVIALSKALGVTEAYIYGWNEDDPRAVIHQTGLKSMKYDKVLELLAFATPDQIDDVIKYIRFVLQDK